MQSKVLKKERLENQHVSDLTFRNKADLEFYFKLPLETDNKAFSNLY